MAQFFKSWSSNILAGLVLLSGPVIVAVLAFLQSVPWYILALAAIATPGVMAWTKLQVDSLWRLRRQTLQKSEKIIRAWLNHTRLSVANSPSPESYYRLLVSLDARHVSVYRQKSDPEMVGIGINLNIPEATHEIMDAITSNSASTLIRDLRMELIRLGIQYSGLQHPLRKISFLDEIVFDQNLTRPAFLDKVFFMIRAQILVSELIEYEAKTLEIPLTMTVS